MIDRKEKIIALVLKRERLRSELSEADKQLDALLSLDRKIPPEMGPPPSFTLQDTAVGSGAKQALAKGEFVQGSIPDQIIQILNASPDRIFSAEDLTDETAGRSNQNVRNALFRMAKHGQIKKLERGRYQAAKRG